MLDANSAKPLYEQIKDYILINVKNGNFEPDTRIPSERELSKRFGVSRVTAGKAVKELVQAGVLYVRIGKGTFISSQPFDQQIETLTSFTEEMAKRGQSATSRVLKAIVELATDELARLLDIPPDTDVVVLKRVRLSDNQPIAIETSNIIAHWCPNILETHNFAHESLYEVLRTEYGVHLTYAEQSFEARQATATEAEALKMKKGHPILYVTRLTYTDDDQPIEYVHSVYRGDRYKVRAVLKQI